MMLAEFLAAQASGSETLLEETCRNLQFLPAEQTEAVIALLVGMLDNPEAEKRWWAVRALSEIPAQKIPAILSKMLADPNLEVRQCAALGLRQRPDPHAIFSLIDLLREPDPLVSRLAGEALAAIGAPAVEPLIGCLENAPHHVRLNAIRALASMRNPHSVPALFEALSDPSLSVEFWANEGLERLGIGMIFYQP